MKPQIYKLLTYLVKELTWVKTITLCNQLNCSSRTVRNLIKEINLPKEYVLSSQNGYMLNPSFRNQVKLDIKSFDETPCSPEDRQQQIIKQLLLSHSRIDVFDMAETLFVSDSTFATDLIHLRKKLAPYHLKINRSKNIITLTGNEKNIRKLMSDTLYKEVSGGLLNISVMERIFDNIDINKIKDVIVKTMREFHFYLNDFGTYDLILHLCIAIDRIRIHQTIGNTVIDLSQLNLSKKHMDVTKTIIQKVETLYGITFNDNEMYEFYFMVFVNVKNYKVDDISLHSLNGIVEQSMIDLVNHIIERVRNEYYVDLNDIGFITRFSLHLNQIQLRRDHYFAKNPLLKSIKSSYPLMFEISTFIGNIISEKDDIILNDHDISYIALHVGMTLEKQLDIESKIISVIISPDYYILRNKIVDSIKMTFHQDLEIYGVYSDESHIEPSVNVDLIISTTQLSTHPNREYILVSPFINSDDTFQIGRAIAFIKEKKHSHLTDRILDLFDENCFITMNDTIDSFTAIDILSSLLIENKNVHPDYTKDVKHRETLSSTSYGNIAMPHSMNMNAIKSTLGIMIFEKPIVWGENMVLMVLMIALEEKDKELFKSVFQQLINVFNSEAFLQKLDTIMSFYDFIDLLTKSI